MGFKFDKDDINDVLDTINTDLKTYHGLIKRNPDYDNVDIYIAFCAIKNILTRVSRPDLRISLKRAMMISYCEHLFINDFYRERFLEPENYDQIYEFSKKYFNLSNIEYCNSDKCLEDLLPENPLIYYRKSPRHLRAVRDAVKMIFKHQFSLIPNDDVRDYFYKLNERIKD